MTHLLWLSPLAILSGIFGRLGGAAGYNTKYRDIGCSLIAVIATVLIAGWHASFWWAYVLIFLLHWGAFSTYWDRLFKGVDNLGFSGCVVGVALVPILVLDVHLWPLVAVRIVALGIIWHCLNKYLPQKGILWWRRDVAEENLRYMSSL